MLLRHCAPISVLCGFARLLLTTSWPQGACALEFVHKGEGLLVSVKSGVSSHPPCLRASVVSFTGSSGGGSLTKFSRGLWLARIKKWRYCMRARWCSRLDGLTGVYAVARGWRSGAAMSSRGFAKFWPDMLREANVSVCSGNCVSSPRARWACRRSR